jgi:hypothetical protein
MHGRWENRRRQQVACFPFLLLLQKFLLLLLLQTALLVVVFRVVLYCRLLQYLTRETHHWSWVLNRTRSRSISCRVKVLVLVELRPPQSIPVGLPGPLRLLRLNVGFQLAFDLFLYARGVLVQIDNRFRVGSRIKLLLYQLLDKKLDSRVCFLWHDLAMNVKWFQLRLS